MASAPILPAEKGATMFKQPTRCSNTSSSTLYSRISVQPLRRLASSCLLACSRRKPNDVEQQLDPAQVDNNISMFQRGGPDGTKVRKREYPTR